MPRGSCLAPIVAVMLLAGCVAPDAKPDEAEFTASFREHVATVEIHRDDVRVLQPEDALAADIIDEMLTGLYRVNQWYKETGIQPAQSSALLNNSEYVMVTFDEVQYFDFVFKESDGALDAIVVLLVVGDVPRADFVDHLVTCLELHCQRLVSDDDTERRERLDAMTE